VGHPLINAFTHLLETHLQQQVRARLKGVGAQEIGASALEAAGIRCRLPVLAVVIATIRNHVPAELVELQSLPPFRGYIENARPSGPSIHLWPSAIAKSTHSRPVHRGVRHRRSGWRPGRTEYPDCDRARQGARHRFAGQCRTARSSRTPAECVHSGHPRWHLPASHQHGQYLPPAQVTPRSFNASQTMRLEGNS